MILAKLTFLEQSSLARGIPIIGAEKGAWLLEQVKLHQPKQILELGTANGYSGIILGSEGAQLTTIDIDPKITAEAKENFNAFGIRAEVIVGDAVQIVNALVRQKKQFDLIFIDFAKKKYIEVLEPSIQMLPLGGIMIADNITMESCQDFKKAVLNHPQLKTKIIKIKDGLSYSERVH